MSALERLLDGFGGVTLDQSMDISEVLDRRRAAANMPGYATSSARAGYEDALSIASIVTGLPVADLRVMHGNQFALVIAAKRFLADAGFELGEAEPATSEPAEASNASTEPLPPATDTRRAKSAR